MRDSKSMGAMGSEMKLSTSGDMHCNIVNLQAKAHPTRARRTANLNIVEEQLVQVRPLSTGFIGHLLSVGTVY